MIRLGPGVRAFAYCAAVDMRKGFEGLWALATHELGRDVLSGELFVFVGRDRRRADEAWAVTRRVHVTVRALEKTYETGRPRAMPSAVGPRWAAAGENETFHVFVRGRAVPGSCADRGALGDRALPCRSRPDRPGFPAGEDACATESAPHPLRPSRGE